MIPVMRPRLPTAEKLVPYIKRIDQSRIYANFGPPLAELEERSAGNLARSQTEVASTSNGTVAFIAALLTAGGPPGKKCLLPTWTFVASAAAIWAANRRPQLVDGSPDTWMLEPDETQGRNT
jgi:dTDP-4-amino-4,6-dideoxygalactose transaminase